MPAWRDLFTRSERASPQAEATPQELPYGTLWQWRPPLWEQPSTGAWTGVGGRTDLSDGVTVFHDCPLAEISMRQIAGKVPPFPLEIEVFAFRGAFLSLVFDLPPSGTAGIAAHHILGLSLTLETEKPIEVFARLNIRHGPNTEQLVQEIPQKAARAHVGFDLHYARFDPARVSHAWLDLIFGEPQMNRIRVVDVEFSRRIRAEI